MMRCSNKLILWLGLEDVGLGATSHPSRKQYRALLSASAQPACRHCASSGSLDEHKEELGMCRNPCLVQIGGDLSVSQQS